MSRSYKKTPSIHWCGKSNKQDKVVANKKFRKVNKQIIKSLSNLDDSDVFKKMREISNVWSFATDGLAYIKPKSFIRDMDWNERKWYIMK